MGTPRRHFQHQEQAKRGLTTASKDPKGATAIIYSIGYHFKIAVRAAIPETL
jgi:hypothetical protein